MASDNLKAIPTDMSADHCGEGTSKRKSERLVSPVLAQEARSCHQPPYEETLISRSTMLTINTVGYWPRSLAV